MHTRRAYLTPLASNYAHAAAPNPTLDSDIGHRTHPMDGKLFPDVESHFIRCVLLLATEICHFYADYRKSTCWGAKTMTVTRGQTAPDCIAAFPALLFMLFFAQASSSALIGRCKHIGMCGSQSQYTAGQWSVVQS
jgi:hypothetical protein